MTNEEAIKWVDTKMCFGRYTPQMHNPFVEDECYKAGKMATEALESAERYKWHNLRKDPNDLPAEYATVEVVLSTVKIYDIAVSRKEYGFRPWYAEIFQDCPEEWKHKVMAWREIKLWEE